jgi:hypothetical protein
VFEKGDNYHEAIFSGYLVIYCFDSSRFTREVKLYARRHLVVDVHSLNVAYKMTYREKGGISKILCTNYGQISTSYYIYDVL